MNATNHKHQSTCTCRHCRQRNNKATVPVGEMASPGRNFSSNNIRWVQQSLNQMFGLRLPIDGVMGVQTRSAIRNLQRQAAGTTNKIARARHGPPALRQQFTERAAPILVRETDELRELSINEDKATTANNKYMHSLGWVDHYARIARDLLGFETLPIAESTFAQAVAEWQQQLCFKTVDGIIGPGTWAEMEHLLGLAPKLAPRTPIPEVNSLMPKAALGYCCHKPQAHRYGLPETVLALNQIGMLWFLKHPSGPRIRIADISQRGGGKFCFGDDKCHASHRIGLDVDIWIMRNDGKEAEVAWTEKKSYSQELTQDLVDTIRNNGVLDVKCIFFNDPGINGVRKQGAHNKHLHVRFCVPTHYKSTVMIKAAHPNEKKPPLYTCPPNKC